MGSDRTTNREGALNDKRNVFGWCAYDWANSAYATTVLAGLLPAYFAAGVVGEGGVEIGGRTFSATTLWGLAVALAAAIIFLAAPVLGAIADYSAAKKRFLLTLAYTGVASTGLLYFCGEGDVFATLVLFVVAQCGFVGANVFYDAFLPQIVSEDRLDRISGRGYACGYIGGALQFALALGLVAGHETLGLTQGQAARIGILSAAAWWGGFTLITAWLLREAPPRAGARIPGDRPSLRDYVRVGFGRTWRTVRRVGRFRQLLLFLIAFMLYSDGIQTVIAMATIYGKDELGLSTTTLMVTLLLIQGVAMVGALLFGRLAGLIGTKRAIMLSLGLWSGIVIYAYFITSAGEYFVLGMLVGLVLGGSQALSRSYYSMMIPAEASAEFFGFYTVFSKFSAIWGPLAFSVIDGLTGSSRASIAAIAVFFVAGLVLLALVDEKEARRARAVGLS